MLAFFKELEESSYRRAFQEILGSKLVKNDVDFIKKEMNDKKDQSLFKERTEKSKIDFLNFFKENYLCYDDKKREDLFWEEIIDYNNFSKSPLFVQWGTHEDLKSPQEGTASTTLSAGASSSSVPPPAPPPPPSAPPPPPPPPTTSTSYPLPTIDLKALFMTI